MFEQKDNSYQGSELWICHCKYIPVNKWQNAERYVFILQNYAAMKMVGPFGPAKAAKWRKEKEQTE